METDKTIEANIKAMEKKRIAEIKSLSYLERLERMMAIIEVSYMLRTATKIQYKRS